MLRSLRVYLTTKCTKKENHKVHKDFQYSTCKNFAVSVVQKILNIILEVHVSDGTFIATGYKET
jgi:hypothetical protein